MNVSIMQRILALSSVIMIGVGDASAQVSKEVLESITTPDKVETSIGILEFLDGAPLPETAKKVYDYLDTMRGVDAFLKGMPELGENEMKRYKLTAGIVVASA